MTADEVDDYITQRGGVQVSFDLFRIGTAMCSPVEMPDGEVLLKCQYTIPTENWFQYQTWHMVSLVLLDEMGVEGFDKFLKHATERSFNMWRQRREPQQYQS